MIEERINDMSKHSRETLIEIIKAMEDLEWSFFALDHEDGDPISSDAFYKMCDIVESRMQGPFYKKMEDRYGHLISSNDQCNLERCDYCVFCFEKFPGKSIFRD